ncbi:30S ribosomal protein S10 [Candidatus Daviesbacteria bacterium RIFCSPHIGHO2_12_FULL_37_11]|uniref:Small ribosomal subunit protein uS10 n=1 Tax=Candidatus Daviesbacteria bacterium RIFCSPHIGHO2_12_FULL_37_11 TaxID=1797777 RepID=A0A1F5KCA2_9BACT|nr:MAG: 30S ribosomal protein S10 [Candidatus Daviesbacteria bacterium GWA1_38_6]OGE16471.1 MAG: 30S ribosomal protein S10 [Candidatus Daviesbacteria bacterium RIFCSPHIGHO2_01_FULL_37_27]OGE38566.1 MAG: 30S ribosomal protein S10 [Candidatus Daviesbacteria bacterium RIFCSPHIGHO2_12_FULL_37_11]OGE46277.1 MAG: 30S ribosomal protein S10 [Candidatus Daviesbacteria bacterium RIFCSPLOWO2_01_FULL_37_10]
MATATRGRIRVRLKSYDHRVLDSTCEQLLDVALRTGAKILGPIPLPTKTERITVLTSPHTDKDAREAFEIKTHKRVLDIIEPTQKTIDSLMHIELPAGVDIEVKM